jgi:hypothetical protein
MCISRFIRFVTWYFSKPEPVRDVSFIVDKKERIMLEEAIAVVNSIPGGWDFLRDPDFLIASEKGMLIVNGLKHPGHNSDSIFATLYLLKHMANNWEEWVLRRSKTQDKDENNKIILRRWVESHPYTPNTNNFILLSYLENLLRITEEWSDADIQGAGADRLIFSIECVISRIFENVEDESDAYKVEVYKKIVHLNLPSDYERSSALFLEHIEFIKEYDARIREFEQKYKEQLVLLKAALQQEDLRVLQEAMLRHKPLTSSVEYILKKFRDMPEYLLAIELEKELLMQEAE